MAFKKVTNISNKENIKKFAEQARGETGLLKQEKKARKPRKEEDKKNKFRYQFFCDQEMQKKIDEVRLETKSQFLRSLIFSKNEYFSDENIVDIFFLAKKEELSIKSFIRKKLNLNYEKTIYNYESEKNIVLVTYLNEDDRKKLNDFFEKSHIQPKTFYFSKILFALETKTLFSFNEQVELKKEAEKFSLSLEEYLMLKIKNI
ncbi:hypothetical protein [Campylobacter lari]|uniref:hypothetical protein n=1 Tax=Campylobacter lari TaxID=201 RepID=UPI0008735BB2|nr:hypothetical protein [Campylobacter lari]MCW0224546.1 hypothetical protein [Campylobacter lari]OEV68545.1 hypothetical protein AJY52_07535 [Campylobacter lari]OEV69791.1 hypothetical protein AJY62_06085 [Campylobacter lari]OEV92500.1 hypothetical protein AJM73_06860 [Campylobacter lari]